MIYLSKGGAGADSDHTWIRPGGGVRHASETFEFSPNFS